MMRNQLDKYIAEKYGVLPDFPWIKYPNYAVYRHLDTRKWFAVVMNIPRSKLGIEEPGNIDIVNLKCDDILIGSLRMEKGFYPAYHMAKTSWITVVLDGTVDEETLIWLLDMSYKNTRTEKKRK